MQTNLFTQTPQDMFFETLMQKNVGNTPHGGGTDSCVYTLIDCDCKYCTENKKDCTISECICFDERLEGGGVPYGELMTRMLNTSSYSIEILKRAKSLLQKGKGDFFISSIHKQRLFDVMLKGMDDNVVSAIYLLCADDFLWSKANQYIKANYIDFSFKIKDIQQKSYPLYRGAKEIYKNRLGFDETELIDVSLIDDNNFILILNAQIILKFGCIVFKNYKAREVL